MQELARIGPVGAGMEGAGLGLEGVVAEGGYDLAVHFAGYAVEVLLNRKAAPLMQPPLYEGAVRYQPITAR